jgi:hypothetical protein
MKMNTPINAGAGAPASADSEPSEETLAAREFALKLKGRLAAPSLGGTRESYEVRPCLRVRGYKLRLPVLGWTLWYPTAADALRFAEKLGAVYQAETRVYNSAGQAISFSPVR